MTSTQIRMNLRWRSIAIVIALCVFSMTADARRSTKKQDLLIKLAPGFTDFQMPGAKIEKLSDSWVRVLTSRGTSLRTLEKNPAVEYVQPNYKIALLEDYSIQDSLRRAALARMISRNPELRTEASLDNPEIPDAAPISPGNDPLFLKQWGLVDSGVKEAWEHSRGNPEMIVAVIDTGVDYTHEDLLPNIWRNTAEVPDNGLDDDGNGYVDDVIGWDFVSDDNRPYDLSMDPLDILFKGGNPGHGTHCAGTIAAKGENSLGVSGVAPEIKIMPLRFLSEKGQGTTADAIKAIHYAVDKGAKIMSNSWGAIGEEAGAPENQALRDAVQYAEDNEVLFIAAAGNGHKGVGYDNDSDLMPTFPASYPHDIIISVAALDANNELGSFSNWGLMSVDIAAPGVKVFSTVVNQGYTDVVVDKMGFTANWDGTSMAAPHVAGAAALYWSANPEKSWQEVKEAVLTSAKKLVTLSGKILSGGKLDVRELLD